MTRTNHEMLIDKLCERWIVELTAMELFESAIHHARRDATLAAMVDRLREFQRQERAHADRLEAAVRQLGGEPSRTTPSALSAAREATGLLEVCRRDDARLPHVLHALLTAELVDNAGWELLCELAEAAGLDEWLEPMRVAAREEKEHLRFIREHLERVERAELAAASSGHL